MEVSFGGAVESVVRISQDVDFLSMCVGVMTMRKMMMKAFKRRNLANSKASDASVANNSDTPSINVTVIQILKLLRVKYRTRIKLTQTIVDCSG